jgi:hypothetical protein
MNKKCARSMFAAGLALAPALGASPSLALDPGTYTVQCQSSTEGAKAVSYDIRMDKVDLLTMQNSFGAIISGVRTDDGRRVILTGDQGCAMIETRARSSSR